MVSKLFEFAKESSMVIFKKISFATILLIIIGISNPILARSPSADLTGDGKVDFKDFSVLASQWLTNKNSADLLVMTGEWLTDVSDSNNTVPFGIWKDNNATAAKVWNPLCLFRGKLICCERWYTGTTNGSVTASC
jgi:hypothetical protein